MKFIKSHKVLVFCIIFFGILIAGTEDSEVNSVSDNDVIIENKTTADETQDNINSTENKDEEIVEQEEPSFNEEFINTYLPMGVPKIIEEYQKLYETEEIDVIHSLFFRNHQPDTSIPVLEEQIVSGEALVIGINTYASDEGTTSAELYLGEYDFDYEIGIAPATEKLLKEHPEEWNKFASVVSNEYMKINRGDRVYFEGKIYGIRNDSMAIRGTCRVK